MTEISHDIEDKTGFDAVAAQYDLSLPAHIIGHYLTKRVNFISALRSRKSERVLDVGCGTGYLVRSLLDRGFDVVGLDASAGMLHETKTRVTGKPLVQGVAEKLPIKTNSFDLVISVALLHHLVSKAAVVNCIREMVRVAKPGGKIIIWDHNPNNPYWPIVMRKVPQDAGETRLVPLREIINGLKRDGEVQEIEVRRNGWIPEFVPKKMMFFAVVIEAVLERVPVIRRLSAHNVVVAKKGDSN